MVVGELGPVVKAEEYWTLNQHAADLNRGSELSWLFFFSMCCPLLSVKKGQEH